HELREERLRLQVRRPALPDILPLRRHHEADVDAVDPDAVGRRLPGQGLGQGDAGRPVHGRGEEIPVRLLAEDGIDVDDAAAAPGLEVGQYGPAAADLGEQLDLQVGLPVGVGQLLEAARDGAAGVVDQHVDAAPAVHHL